jgi:hypothetical protein
MASASPHLAPGGQDPSVVGDRSSDTVGPGDGAWPFSCGCFASPLEVQSDDTEPKKDATQDAMAK